MTAVFCSGITAIEGDESALAVQ